MKTLSYDNKRCSLLLLLSFAGSVFPQAFMVALPNMGVTIAIYFIFNSFYPDGGYTADLGGGQLWSSFNIAMSLLLVFRTQQAYSRWWEGGSLLQQIRGEWYNAASSLIAFCSNTPDKVQEVKIFQHMLVRLMSMLYCSALQQVAMMDDDCFEVIDNEGIDEAKLEYLQQCHNRSEVLLQWIQRLIVNNMGTGVLPIPPPVISRVFQELSRGIVNLNNLRKIKQFPFPFPYAQMVTFMLSIHWLLTPLANYVLIGNLYYSALLSFVSIFAFWSINYIAVEIEMPFGDDVNDLPIVTMQRDLNRSLLILLDKRVQEPPTFEIKKSFHHKADFKMSNVPLNQISFERKLSMAWPQRSIESKQQHSSRQESGEVKHIRSSKRSSLLHGRGKSVVRYQTVVLDGFSDVHSEHSDTSIGVHSNASDGRSLDGRSIGCNSTTSVPDLRGRAHADGLLHAAAADGRAVPGLRMDRSAAFRRDYDPKEAPGPIYNASSRSWVPRTLSPVTSPNITPRGDPTGPSATDSDAQEGCDVPCDVPYTI